MDTMAKSKKPHFQELSPEEKERVYQEIDRKTPAEIRAESRPPTKSERARLERIARKIGRPKIGKGAKVVSISVERDLLKRVDVYAKSVGLNRSELFIAAVRGVVGKAIA
jgi:hypothetical protein